MKIIAFAGLLFVTVYLPLVGNAPQSSGPTATPLVTATEISTASPTNSPIPSPTGQTPTSSETPTPTQTAAPTGTVQPTQTPTTATTSAPAHRRINAPYLASGAGLEQAAIAWFGQVDNTNNYADIRVFYRDESLRIFLNIFDRRLWFDTSPTQDTLEAWDAATLLLDTGSGGPNPSATSHRFVAQLNNSPGSRPVPDRVSGRRLRLDSSATTEFTSIAGWRGDGVNSGAEARGWSVRFDIPFASLGTNVPPAADGCVAHGPRAARPGRRRRAARFRTRPGRSTQTGSGRLPGVNLRSTCAATHRPLPRPVESTTVRNGLDGAVSRRTPMSADTAPAASPMSPTSSTVGATPTMQATISSTYKISRTLPTGPVSPSIMSRSRWTVCLLDGPSRTGTLTLHLFGNAGQGATPEPQPSLVQALTVADNWNESTVTWNNAPLAAENVWGNLGGALSTPRQARLALPTHGTSAWPWRKRTHAANPCGWPCIPRTPLCTAANTSTHPIPTTGAAP